MGLALYAALSAIVAEALTVILVKYWIDLVSAEARAGSSEPGSEEACRGVRRRHCALCLSGVDVNKLLGGRGGCVETGPLVPEAGGLWPVFSTVVALLVFEAFYTYGSGVLFEALPLAALSMVLLIAAVIGLVDDIVGLPPKLRVVFSMFAAIPLIPFKLGVSRVDLPLIGVVDLGLAYPLIAVPIGVAGAANAFNMLAGLNGLEAGSGIVLMAFTLAYAYLKGLHFVAVAALVMLASLAGFIVFNWYKARVFPGNAFTYGVGAYYAGLVIIGDFQKFGLALFTPYFIELIYYFRSVRDGVRKENFGVLSEDGGLRPPHQRAYSLTHAAMKALSALGVKPTEPRVTMFILALEAAVGTAALVVFT